MARTLPPIPKPKALSKKLGGDANAMPGLGVPGVPEEGKPAPQERLASPAKKVGGGGKPTLRTAPATLAPTTTTPPGGTGPSQEMQQQAQEDNYPESWPQQPGPNATPEELIAYQMQLLAIEADPTRGFKGGVSMSLASPELRRTAAQQGIAYAGHRVRIGKTTDKAALASLSRSIEEDFRQGRITGEQRSELLTTAQAQVVKLTKAAGEAPGATPGEVQQSQNLKLEEAIKKATGGLGKQDLYEQTLGLTRTEELRLGEGEPLSQAEIKLLTDKAEELAGDSASGAALYDLGKQLTQVVEGATVDTSGIQAEREQAFTAKVNSLGMLDDAPPLTGTVEEMQAWVDTFMKTQGLSGDFIDLGVVQYDDQQWYYSATGKRVPSELMPIIGKYTLYTSQELFERFTTVSGLIIEAKQRVEDAQLTAEETRRQALENDKLEAQIRAMDADVDVANTKKIETAFNMMMQLIATPWALGTLQQAGFVDVIKTLYADASEPGAPMPNFDALLNPTKAAKSLVISALPNPQVWMQMTEGERMAELQQISVLSGWGFDDLIALIMQSQPGSFSGVSRGVGVSR